MKVHLVVHEADEAPAAIEAWALLGRSWPAKQRTGQPGPRPGRGAAWMIGCLWSQYGGLQLARVLRGLQRVPSRTCHLSTDQNDCRRSG